MSRTLLLAVLLSVAPFAAGQMKGMDMKDMDMKSDKKGQVHKATGVVTKIEKEKVTIKHEPVRSINWPAMTMAFTVKDKAMLAKLAKDSKVDFEFVKEGRDYVVTAVK